MKLNSGEFLYRQGDLSESMYVIRSGEIGLFSHSNEGMTELMRMGPGQLVGDLAFFTGAVRTTSAKALATSECLEVQYSKVRDKFEAVPSWLKIMTKTLAEQVQTYSREVRNLKTPEDSVPLPRLAVARAWAALTLVPQQFGQHDGNEVSIDWSKLRTYANLSFREVSTSVMQLANILSSLQSAEIFMTRDEPSRIVFKDSDLIVDFLRYYIRALSNDSPELAHVNPIEFQALEVLAGLAAEATPDHKGVVSVHLTEFKKRADQMGFNHLDAPSIDLLIPYGIEIERVVTEDSVRARFHQREIINMLQFWRILQAIQQLNTKKSKAS